VNVVFSADFVDAELAVRSVNLQGIGVKKSL